MGCVKETIKAIVKMPLITFFPVLQGVGFLVFMVAWTFYAANLASMGEVSAKQVAAGNIQFSVRIFLIEWLFLSCFFLQCSMMIYNYCDICRIVKGPNICLLRLYQAVWMVHGEDGGQ